MNTWCILRTAGRSTLPLAESLNRAGYAVWTPAQELNRRRPRSTSRIGLRVPMTPTYVFADAVHLVDLIELSSNPGREHEGFSVMHCNDMIPILADFQLDPLRLEEEKARPKVKSPRKTGERYGPGESVRLHSGSFAGLDGLVVTSDSRTTTLDFGANMRLKISTFILRQGQVSSDSEPTLGIAA